MVMIFMEFGRRPWSAWAASDTKLSWSKFVYVFLQKNNSKILSLKAEVVC